ncbi:MAG: cysteine desulfurase [Candidatus Paracaedibacteraceae bacterium]|nr:cysteine desulfurase [Candidatus Paracaedibacteraceae bacterium]
MNRIYLDHNATTLLLPAAQTAVIEAMGQLGNASSVHSNGRSVRLLLEEARSQVADYFTVKPSQIVFTSGATEANNMILKGFSGRIITSAIEHDSVLEANKAALRCQVDSEGRVDLNHLEELLKGSDQPTLVSIMTANNETGVIQPLADIVTIARQYGAKIHSDAVQGIGKLATNWANLKLDFISLSGHKIGALQGIGALVVNEHSPITPLLRGGGQERYYRSGTENTVGIVSLGAAIKAYTSQDWSGIERLRDQLETQLLQICPTVTIFGQKAPRLPNTSCFATPGIASNTQVMHFDLMGISVSAGSACSSGKVKISPVLQAMGVKEPTLGQSLRLSLGQSTTPQDSQKFIDTWRQLYERTQKNLKERIAS